MIERVAKAIDMVPSNIDAMTQRRAEARAAIEAMRELRPELIRPAMRYLRTDSETNLWAAWQAIIDAALKEKADGTTKKSG